MPRIMTMRNVIETLGMASQLPVTDGEKAFKCPFCGDPNKKDKKMYINGGRNVWNCFHCGRHGGPEEFWAEERGLNMSGPDWKKDAFKDFMSVYEGGAGHGRRRKREVAERKLPQRLDVETAPVEKRSAVYQALLSGLYLSGKHIENLTERGFDKKTIRQWQYKSFSGKGNMCEAVANQLIKDGFELEGVPGFFQEFGKWKFVNYGSGFLIPDLDLEGRIQSLQIRRDQKALGGPRYLTISSAEKPKGAKGAASPHFRPGPRGVKSIILTEGPLKADLVSFYTGYSVLAVLGVQSLGRLPEMLGELRERGTSEIISAYDADMKTNENVRRAYEKLVHIIASEGLRFTRCDWPPDAGKGLDDVFKNAGAGAYL